jgi:hypothetical protein
VPGLPYKVLIKMIGIASEYLPGPALYFLIAHQCRRINLSGGRWCECIRTPF